MVSTWFTSDTQMLHHRTAVQRGFATAGGHDEMIIANWNSRVGSDDIVWHLGDVGLGSEERILEAAARLNGRKQLILGNHDRPWPGHQDARGHQRRWLEVFESVQAFARTRIGDYPVLLSHFPYEADHSDPPRHTQYRLRDQGAWLIHGHLHAPVRLGTQRRWLSFMGAAPGGSWRGLEVHAGLDAWDLHPAGEADIIALIRQHEKETDPENGIELVRERLAAIQASRIA
jgi:calcineurin-like phosphoesterase family protein